MKTFVYLFSTLILVGAVAGQTESPITPTPSDDFECLTNGNFPHPTDCRKYYVCTNGLAWEEHCPGDLWYDPIRDICDYPDLVSCAASPPPSSTTPGSGFTCPDGLDGVYPDSADCTKYYVCTGGVLFPEQCPDGLWFDSITKQCDWAETAHCDAGPAPSSTMSPSSTPGASSPSPSTSETANPSSTVSASSTVSQSSTVFASSTVSQSSTVDASSTASQSSTVSASSTPSTSTSGGGGFRCPPNGTDGTGYPHPDDCTKYFICSGGIPIAEECPGGLWFDFEIQICNYPEVTNCAASPPPTSTSAPSLFGKFRI